MNLHDELIDILETGLEATEPDGDRRHHVARNLAQGVLCVLHRTSKQNIRALVERERAIYWCVLLYVHHRSDDMPMSELMAFLDDIGYLPLRDRKRVDNLLRLGEPGVQT